MNDIFKFGICLNNHRYFIYSYHRIAHLIRGIHFHTKMYIPLQFKIKLSLGYTRKCW